MINGVHHSIDELFLLISNFKTLHPSDSELKNPKPFFQQFSSNFPTEDTEKKLAERRVADCWRCIKFAVQNNVPKKYFVLSNYKRMQTKMVECGGSDSDSTDSDSTASFSSCFDDILRTSPLVHLDEMASSDCPPNAMYPADSAPSACPEKQTSQSKKTSKKREKRSQGKNSRCPNTSEFEHDLV